MNLESQYNKFHPTDLIGWYGLCEYCGLERKVHSFDCSKRLKPLVSDDSYMRDNPGLCMSCSVKFKNPVKKVKWKRKLSKQQVLKDLSIMMKGVNINYDEAERTAVREAKLDGEVQNMTDKAEDAYNWAIQKDQIKGKFISI